MSKTKRTSSGIPARDRGVSYKVQFFEEHTMSWKDVQKRYPHRAQALDAAAHHMQVYGTPVRLMRIDGNTGVRTPEEPCGMGTEAVVGAVEFGTVQEIRAAFNQALRDQLNKKRVPPERYEAIIEAALRLLEK